MIASHLLDSARALLLTAAKPGPVSLLQRRLRLPYRTATQLLRQVRSEMNPEIARFTSVVREALRASGHLDLSGATLYSEAHTLRRGPVYLLGTNPGGSNDDKDTVAASLAGLATSGNAYVDEVWDRCEVPGGAPLQRRVQDLLVGLGLKTRDVCAANLVFQRTARVTGLNFWQAADACWPIHEHLLGVVRPRLVIAFGNSETSAYAYLAKKLPRAGKVVEFDAGHGSWQCRGFETEWQGHAMYVAGIPHMSYYSPTAAGGVLKPAVGSWLREALGGAAPLPAA